NKSPPVIPAYAMHEVLIGVGAASPPRRPAQQAYASRQCGCAAAPSMSERPVHVVPASVADTPKVLPSASDNRVGGQQVSIGRAGCVYDVKENSRSADNQCE